MTISNLKKVLEFYGINLLTGILYESFGILETLRHYPRLQKIIWICEVMSLKTEQAKRIISKYANQVVIISKSDTKNK